MYPVSDGDLWLLIACCCAAQATEPNSAPALDLLIVAPHSDDEAIGCTGVMLRAIAEKKRPGVVVLTAGDGFPKAAAALAKKEPSQLVADDFVKLAELRQRHSLQAMERLGLKADDLMFLGYPDGGLAKMYEAQTDADGKHSQHWPQFLGPDGNNIAPTAVRLPERWSNTENIAWRTDILGEVWSSPVGWGQQIWMATAVDDGLRCEPFASIANPARWCITWRFSMPRSRHRSMP